MFIFLGGFSVLLCIRSLAWVFRHAPFLFWKVSPYPQQDTTVSRKCIWIHGKTYIQSLLTHHFESFNCSNTLFMTFWIFSNVQMMLEKTCQIQLFCRKNLKWKFREFPKLLFDAANDKLRDLFVESFPVSCSFLPAQSIIISPLWQWIINENGKINKEIL